MVLVDLEEVEIVAGHRSIDLDSYGENEIGDMISSAQEYIETETGRIFDCQEKVDEKYYYQGYNYLLDYYPVISIELIKINDQEYDGEYDLDKKNGVIYFPRPIPLLPSFFTEEYNIHVEYTAGYTDGYRPAKQICIDLVLATVKYHTTTISGSGQVSSIKEKNLQVNYSTSTYSTISSYVLTDVDARLEKLKGTRLRVG